MRSSLPLFALALAAVALSACGVDDDDDGGDDGDTEEAIVAVVAVAETVEPATAVVEATSDTAPSVGRSATTLTPGMSWYWQLQGEIDTSIDTSIDADVYDVDLFDTPDAVIEQLHDEGRIVICYFSTAYEDWRADAADWPEATLGSSLDDWEGERWVDIRNDDARAVLIARLDLAAARGCDGVEPDNVTAYRNDSGFELTVDDQLEFNRLLAEEAHGRGLTIGLKNALELIPDLVGSFDFAVNEQCAEYDECGVYAPFVDADKPVFGAEYSDDAVDDPDGVCAVAEETGISMLILPVELDGSFRVSC